MQSAAFTFALFEFVLLIFSLSVHECCACVDGFASGRPDGAAQGRVTLNPMYHIDPVGTLLFPAIIDLRAVHRIQHVQRQSDRLGQTDAGHHPQFSQRSSATTIWSRWPGPPRTWCSRVRGSVVLLIVMLMRSPGGRRDCDCILFSAMLLPGVNLTMQAMVLLGVAAIEINFALFFFNLLPIPPLDGSHLLRNLLPYNAVQAYDRIPFWVSWMLMIFVGGYIMRLLLCSGRRCGWC